MWYEILPSFAILFAGFAVPAATTHYIHKLMLGNPYKRDLRQDYDYMYLVRDISIANGNAYNQQGLENIPDEEPKK